MDKVLFYDISSVYSGSVELPENAIGFKHSPDGGGSIFKGNELFTSEVIDASVLLDASLGQVLSIKRVAKDITEADPDPIIAGMMSAPYVNVLDYGLVNDGETDNAQLLMDLYAEHPYETLYFPAGTYVMKDEVSLGLMHIYLDRATLSWKDCSVSYAIKMNGYLPGEPALGENGFSGSMNVINGHKPTFGSFITGRGGTIECNQCAKSGIYVGTQMDTDISHITIRNFVNYGIHQPAITYTYDDNGTTKNAYFSFQVNCHHLLLDNDYDDSHAWGGLWSTGIALNGDCAISDVNMINCHTAINSGGSCSIVNVHAWTYDFKSSKDYKIVEGSVFYVGSADMITNCYIDTYQTGFKLSGPGTMITNARFFVNGETWDYGSLVPTFIKMENSTATFTLYGADVLCPTSNMVFCDSST